MTIEARCRAICIANKINPDANAPKSFQTMPGFKRAPDGRVKQWMIWITTVGKPKRKPQMDKRTAAAREDLQRMIADSDERLREERANRPMEQTDLEF